MARIDSPDIPLIPAQAGIHANIQLDTRLRGYERMGEGIRRLLIMISVVLLVACGQRESSAQITSIDELLEQVRADAKKSTEVSEADKRFKENRDKEPIVFSATSPSIFCEGVFEQGGAAICKTSPNAVVEVGGVKTKADNDGFVIIGFDRDAPKTEVVSSTFNGKYYNRTIKIAPRKYTTSRIDGLPPSQVSNYSKEQLVRIRSSSARKKIGFASREQTMWFKDGFDYPLKEFVKTSPFGAQRILNGIKKKPHYGVDIAAPVGTPIYAPADGVVSLADDDLYFEGAMVLLDHGQGLISMYLHMSAIDVTLGQVVKRGEKLGEVGSKGRSTGPHLCWRLKWRNRHLDPELLTEWPSHEHAND